MYDDNKEDDNNDNVDDDNDDDDDNSNINISYNGWRTKQPINKSFLYLFSCFFSILPAAWRYGIIAGTGSPGFSILWLDEIESLTCNFYLSVAVHTVVLAHPSLRYTSMFLAR